jgi:ClpP class serine protease
MSHLFQRRNVMSRKAIYLPLVITIIFSALLLGLVSSCAPPSGSTMFGDRIGLLYIEGIITSGQPSESFFITGGATSDHIVEVVNQAIDDNGIKALVVRINSRRLGCRKPGNL